MREENSEKEAVEARHPHTLYSHALYAPFTP